MDHRDGWGEGKSVLADNATERSQVAERDRVRIEFYATYDVMTGVRIAATLGGFFALMVFLIVYKSRSKSVKALNDPKIVELAEAVVAEEQAVEEERQLSAALEEALSERRRSRPQPAAAPAPAKRGPRRPSSATCSSSGSSYLERRGSSVVCALPERRLLPCPSERLAPLAPLAPLASVGSVGASYALECELVSVGADSVFGEEDAPSTDDEVEQFSTDSGGGGEPGERAPPGAPLRLHRLDRPARPPRPPRLQRPSHSRETLF